MEERVGQLWDRLLMRWVNQEHSSAAVTLQQVMKPVGILYRALGGAAGVRIEAVAAHRHGGWRAWRQRLAGSGMRADLAWCDDEVLRLPARVAHYPEAALNRDVYLWLAALAAQLDGGQQFDDWFIGNQRLTQRLLATCPGMRQRYQRLLQAELRRRVQPARLPAAQARQEQALRAALQAPGSQPRLPVAKRSPAALPLWLYPPRTGPATSLPADAEDPDEHSTSEQVQGNKRRHRAQYTEMPNTKDGLLIFRFETLLSWAEYVRVNRCGDDDENDAASSAADDMEQLHLARDSSSVASRVRFDLDLPAAAYDDIALSEGILLPEWDYRKRRLQQNHCRVQPMVARAAVNCELPKHLQVAARRLRQQFEALRPERRWFKAQVQGSDIDVDAYVRYAGERSGGNAAADKGLYRDFRGAERDLSCLLLADVSLSTDSWINNDARVIDVIHDSLFLFAEALSATHDDFAIHAFSSRKRSHVRMHAIKGFDEPYDAAARGRIAAIKPGYYTRMGAAIRYATDLLQQRPAQQRLLLLLTDGKPNDLDHYEGRYGIEDTRMAIQEARRLGLQPFCVTIDERAEDYLPHVFGSDAYIVIHRPSQLPQQLPLLYARLTQ